MHAPSLLFAPPPLPAVPPLIFGDKSRSADVALLLVRPYLFRKRGSTVQPFKHLDAAAMCMHFGTKICVGENLQNEMQGPIKLLKCFRTARSHEHSILSNPEFMHRLHLLHMSADGASVRRDARRHKRVCCVKEADA